MSHRMASAMIARSPLSACLKSQSVMNDPEFGTALQARESYEGNVAFQIGKDSETGERHERGFRLLKVFIRFCAGLSVYKREANDPVGMH
jgi:hypothetical protein